jgi:Ni/Fe-hydrogenase subunit HybB-like protein
MATLIEAPTRQVRADLWSPLSAPSRTYLLVAAVCGIFISWAATAWIYQLVHGIGVAGIRRPVFWGFYIINFVFWIGISHAGTLISAILRLANARWGKPVTRAAEAITIFALSIGAVFPILHLGRSWVFFWLIPYPNERLIWPNFRSPLLWDVTAIFTYLSASILYFYLPLIPDAAELAEVSTGWRRVYYRALSLNWVGSDRQWLALERTMKLMAGIILAIAVSVHSVVAWDFAMAIAPMWHSTIFAPYFLAGAIFSGFAALAVVIVALRRLLHLEKYLRPVHFDNLGKLLLLLSLVWGYFTVAEHLTIWYGKQPAEYAVFQNRVYGEYAPFFWAMVGLNLVIPFILLSIRRLRSMTTVAIAGSTIVVGMWIERYLIVVTSLSRPHLPSAWGSYSPSWVELSITAGTFAGLILLYMISSKLIPMIAVWEYKDVPGR